MFEAIAGRYVLLNHLLSAGIGSRWRRRAIRALSLVGRTRGVRLCNDAGHLLIHVLPRIGRALSRHDAAYGYLRASIDTFATPADFVKTLRQAGFRDISTVRMTFGSVCLYVARRG